MFGNMGIALAADIGVAPALARISAIVVPADTASLVTDLAPIVSIGTFVDTIFAPEINSVVLGSSVARQASSVNRSIYVCSRTSTAIASAPAAVQALAATLATRTDQSYAIYGTTGSDVWIVGNNAMALRHGMNDHLERVGIRYLGPHSAERIPSTRGSLEISANEVMSPLAQFNYSPNGGIGNGALPAGLPGRQASVDSWTLWMQQIRCPSEILSGFSDGDEAFTGDRFQELDGDHSLLCWVALGRMNAATLTFAATTVTRAAGDFIAEGFAVGQSLVVSGTTSNNWTKLITGATSTVLTFAAGGGVVETTAGATVGGYRRGYSESGNYPTGNCAAMLNTLTRVCMTHHGASGTGSYPATPPAGPSPWTALSAALWRETCSVNPPGGAIPPDTGLDNATNPSVNYSSFNGLIKIHTEHHLGSWSQRAASSGFPHPTTRAVSAEPNDGTYFCQCAHCVNLLRNGPYSAYLTGSQQTQDATDSDKLWHLVNENAKYFTYMLQNAVGTDGKPVSVLVGALGYVTHTAPPSIPIQPNTITVVSHQSAITSTLLASESIGLWVTKRATNPLGTFKLGTFSLWGGDQTNFAKPSVVTSPRWGARYVKDWITRGYSLLSMESGLSSHVQALQLRLIAALCWRPTLDVEAFITEYFVLKYGPAAAIVQAMYERWWVWHEPTPQTIAAMWADMVTAQAALDAAPDPIAPAGRAFTQRNLNFLKTLIEWQRRYAEFFAARTDYDNGKLTAGGGATAAVTLSVTRSAPSVIRVEIDGAGTFKWLKNADAATVVFEATGVAYTAGGAAVTLGTTGRAVTFPTGSYSVGHFWSEAPNVTVLQTAYDRCLEWAWRASSTNVVHSNRLAAGDVNGRVFATAPHPYSSSSSGTSTPLLTVVSRLASGIMPTAGTSYLTLECVLGGALGTAQIRWSRDSGATWTTFTTPASSSTPVTLTAAGIVITCAAGTYALNNRWYMTFDPAVGNWQYLNGASPCKGWGWGGILEPTTAELNALVASGVAAYAPIVGVSRRTFDDTSYKPFNVSGATTLNNGPQFQFPHKHVIRTPANPTTIKLQTFGLGGVVQGKNVRAVLSDMAGNVLQSWSFATLIGSGNVVNDMAITQPAGVYQLTVLDAPNTFSASRLQIPQNVGAVLVNDWFDAVATPVIAQDPTKRMYFYVPAGETKIVMALAQQVGPSISPVQFYDPTGTPVSTTYAAPSQWTCAVGGGQDNAAWSFTGWAASDNTRVTFFENCPNRLAPSPYQLLIP